MNTAIALERARISLRQLWHDARAFPWRNTAWTFRERFREDRLGVTAGSLTFTTLISLVPLFSVGLAVFSAFPMFGRLQTALQRWLVDSLVPDNIARQVLGYLNQFASKAGQIGWTGALLLLVTALALILTIDRKLNDIWRVRQPRPLAQRVLVYWAVLTLGPLLAGGSLTLTSYALSASKGLVAALPGGLKWGLGAAQFLLVVVGGTLLYRFVPNARVRWAHAWLGGLFLATGLELGQKSLAWYLGTVPTYSLVYGAFATLPILLVWMYLAWVVVLLGAVMVAYLPSLLNGVARRGDTPGWDFQLALEVLGLLQALQGTPRRGLSLAGLSERLRVDPLQLEGPVEALQALDWVGRLDEDEERYVLLVEPRQVPLAPLVQRLLLPWDPATRGLWQASAWERQSLAQALQLGDARPLSAPQTGL